MSDRLKQAIDLHRQGELNQAHEIYNELFEAEPEKASIIHLIGLLALEIGKPLDAMQFFARAVELDKDQPDFLFSLAYCTAEMGWGWEEQTIEAYQRCIILRPTYAEAFSNLGQAFTAANRYEEAIQCYRKAIHLQARAVAAYIGLAITLKRMGLQSESTETLELAIQVMPSVAQPNESLEQTLDRLEQDRPVVYKPRVVAPELEDQPTGPKPKAAPRKEKPKIRLIHQLAISGGSLICRCLGSMNGVAMFNNIHPQASTIKDYGVNIFAQAAGWYRCFSPDDQRELAGRSVTFPEAVEMIRDRIESRGDYTVLRNWAHLDYHAVPFLEKPSFKNGLTEALSEDFNVLEVCTVQHPLDNWFGVSRLSLMQNKLTLDDFLQGYKAFAEYALEAGYVRMEDFYSKPDDTLSEICEKLELPFDPDYRERWKFYKRISEEADDHPGTIEAPDPARIPQGLFEDVEANFDYWSILPMLGYEHVQQLS